MENFKPIDKEVNMEKFLVQKVIDNEVYPKIMTANELIEYIDMADCHDEMYEIFDCTSMFGEVKKLHYKGWQPNCLIEVVDEHGNIVLRGHGTDH